MYTQSFTRDPVFTDVTWHCDHKESGRTSGVGKVLESSEKRLADGG